MILEVFFDTILEETLGEFILEEIWLGEEIGRVMEEFDQK